MLRPATLCIECPGLLASLLSECKLMTGGEGHHWEQLRVLEECASKRWCSNEHVGLWMGRREITDIEFTESPKANHCLSLAYLTDLSSNPQAHTVAKYHSSR